jgi:hypothetical protein
VLESVEKGRCDVAKNAYEVTGQGHGLKWTGVLQLEDGCDLTPLYPPVWVYRLTGMGRSLITNGDIVVLDVEVAEDVQGVVAVVYEVIAGGVKVAGIGRKPNEKTPTAGPG